MDDHLVRGTAEQGAFRVLGIVGTDLVEAARQRHDTYPVATAALGRSLLAALLLTPQLKGRGHVTLRVLGSGPLGAIVADARPDGTVRGYVHHPHILLPLDERGKLAVGRGVGLPGQLTVSWDIQLRHPYSGTVALRSGEIAEDLAYYLLESEQTPSAVALGVLVRPDGSVQAAGGFLVTPMPGLAFTAAHLEARIGALPAVTTLVDQGLDASGLLATIWPSRELKLSNPQPVRFACTCSWESGLNVLRLLGPDELRAMYEEDQGAELTCHFCGQVWKYSAPDLAQFLPS